MLTLYYSSVALGSEVVPESLLKKRKSQEKAREVRAAETQKKRAVSPNMLIQELQQMFDDDILPIKRLDLWVDVVPCQPSFGTEKHLLHLLAWVQDMSLIAC